MFGMGFQNVNFKLTLSVFDRFIWTITTHCSLVTNATSLLASSTLQQDKISSLKAIPAFNKDKLYSLLVGGPLE